MGILLERLAEVCRQELLREKVLVVPSLAIGHQIGDALARGGTPWVNLRVETIRTIADAVASADLTERGLTVLSRAQALALVERACDAALTSTSYFAALDGAPGLYRAIQRSIDDLRHAGLPRDGWPSNAFEDSRKASDLAAVITAYENELRERGYVDRFGVLARAIELASAASRPGARWLVVDDVELSPAEERLLSLVSGGELSGELSAVGCQLSGEAAPIAARFVRAAGEENEVRAALRAILRGSSPVSQSPVPSSGAAAPPSPTGRRWSSPRSASLNVGDRQAAFLFPHSVPADDESRELKGAQAVKRAPWDDGTSGPGDQKNGATREPRDPLTSPDASNASFDDAEIIYTTRDPYLSLTYELVSEYDVPTTFAEGIAAHYTRPGQACIGFLRWLADDCASVHLERIARAGAMRFGDEFAPLTPFAFARVLRESQIGWGVDRYLTRVGAHLRNLETRFEDADSDASSERRAKDVATGKAAVAAVERIIAIASPAIGVEVDSSVLARTAREFLDAFKSLHTEFDGMAFAALSRMLDELAVLPSEPLPFGAAAERLIDAVRATHVGASNPRPGHLHVAPVRGGGWSGRRQIFVVGLDDAKHPGRGLQDPVVLDQERVAINDTLDTPRLQLHGEAPVRTSAQFHRLLGRVSAADVTLSWSELDLRERRGGFPSRDVLEVYRAMHGAEATYDQLVKHAASAGFLEADAPLSESEWWLRTRFLDRRLDLADDVLAAYPWLAAGARAGEARTSEAITEYDGKINIAPDELDPRRTGKVYSASQLEKMASCPFGWFLDRVLGVRPIEEMERVADQWLNPRDFGSMFHSILQRGMTAIIESKKKPSLAAHRELLRSIAMEEIAAYRDQVPVPSEAAFIRQRDEILDACDIFLRTEERRAGEQISAKYFEVPFGFAKEPGEAMGLEAPLVIPFAEGELRLRGRIDRVDRNDADGTWQVWDYKTGSLWAYRSAWRLKQGTKVQHAIYARAMTEMLRANGVDEEVGCSGYYFPTRKGDGELDERECGDAELERALGHVFDVVGSGFFPLPVEGECAFCDFKPICRSDDAKARAFRKLEANADEPAVKAWRALQEVE